VHDHIATIHFLTYPRSLTIDECNRSALAVKYKGGIGSLPMTNGHLDLLLRCFSPLEININYQQQSDLPMGVQSLRFYCPATPNGNNGLLLDVVYVSNILQLRTSLQEGGRGCFGYVVIHLSGKFPLIETMT